MTGVSSGAVPCLAGISYAFPPQTRTIGELGALGALSTDAATLREFGFGRVHVAHAESPYDLARQAAAELLASHSVDPETIGLLVYGGTPSTMAFAPAHLAAQGAAGLCTKERFRFPATRLQFDLGLDRATVFALDQLACTTLFCAVRLARSLCLTEGIERALCVASEFFPLAAGREALFNCTSDAAVAVLVERDGPRNRLIAATSVTKGYYWDTETQRHEIVASYFPTAASVIAQTIAGAGWCADDVDWVIPHNVSTRSWEILLGLVPLPRARLWSANIARRGHTLAGDNFINLADATREGAVRPGDRALLFSYGYGAHWTAIAMEA